MSAVPTFPPLLPTDDLVERLRAALSYDPLTGVFVWRTGPRAGKVAGTVSHGYVAIKFDRRIHRAHRLAWLHMFGRWPAQQVDHINGDRVDNRIANLRDVSNAANGQNRYRARADSRTGVQGVFRRKGRFEAAIGVDGKVHYLGLYATVDAARAAYLAAKSRLHIGGAP